jgi:hypothetical protein
MNRAIVPIVVIVGFFFPWGVAELPLPVRIASLIILSVLSLGLLSWGWCRQRSKAVLAGIWWASVTVAVLWISIISFSAEASKHSYIRWLLIVPIVIAPWIWMRWTAQESAWRGRARIFILISSVALACSLFLASPARRYDAPWQLEEIRAVSSEDAHRNMEWVVRHIQRKSAPFTDNARDTLHRGYAMCGGMANLLNQMLRVQGIDSRIVHFEKGRDIHTLVEYWDEKLRKWVLLDPDKNLTGLDFGALSGADVILHRADHIPSGWLKYESLYVYVPHHGYTRVTLDRLDEFY